MKIIDIIKPKYSPNQDTFIAFGLGMLAIVFSLLMIYFPTDWGHWIFRIIFQISIVGIIIPLYLMSKNNELKEAGLRFNKPLIYILISIGIANHWLICFPFWWIGGTVDVLTKAKDISDLSGLDWGKSIFMLTIIIASLFYFGIGKNIKQKK